MMKTQARFLSNTPCQAQQVKVGGLILGTKDSQGVTWFVQDLPGWDDLSFDGQAGRKSWADGDWVGPQWVEARRFGITVWIKTGYRRRAELERAYNQLVSALPIREPSEVVVKTFDKTLGVTARLETGIKTVRHSDTAWQVSLLFVASDPLRYVADWDSGELDWQEWVTKLPARIGGLSFPFTAPFVFDSNESSGSIEFTIKATAGRGLIEITGPVSALSVTDTAAGWQFAYGEPLLAGETLRVDPFRRRVEVNGASRRGLFQGDWPSFHAGQHRIVWSGKSAYKSARLRVRVVETYL